MNQKLRRLRKIYPVRTKSVTHCCARCWAFHASQKLSGMGFCFRLRTATKPNKSCMKFKTLDQVITEQFRVKRKLDL